MEQPELTPQFTEVLGLRDYWRVVRQRWWVVALCVVVVTATAVGMSLRQAPVYRATTTVVHQGTSLAQAVLGANVANYQDPARVMQTAASSVTVEDVATRAKQELNSPRSPDELARMVTATPSTNSDLLQISATSGDAAEAAKVSNAFADGFVAVELDKTKANIALARRVVDEQLKDMSVSQLQSPRGVSLTEQAQTLAIVEQLQTGEWAISRPAETPTSPFSPQPLRNGLLALMVGLVLGVGLAFAMEYADRRLRTEESLEREFGLPVLASVPTSGSGWAQDKKRGTKRRQGTKAVSPVGFASGGFPMIEAFRMLRSNLQYFEVDGRLGTILITSALPQEGKTVTTVNLALSLALAGSRVIIVEADLRRPVVHTYLGLSNEVGVSSVAAGSTSLADALQVVQVNRFGPPDSRSSANGTKSKSLFPRAVLAITSGPLPPNPTELVASARMRQLLNEAASKADYVLVDSPPLLSVADAIPLAGHVDAVLLAARLSRTTIEEAREVRAILSRLGDEVRPIGLVATGAKPHGSYYRYGYYEREAAEQGGGSQNGRSGHVTRRGPQPSATPETAPAAGPSLDWSVGAPPSGAPVAKPPRAP